MRAVCGVTQAGLPTFLDHFMTTIVEFRARRKAGQAEGLRAPSERASSGGEAPTGEAEIILMPLTALSQLRRAAPRKPLRRRSPRLGGPTGQECGLF
jgi:hypothetical protein